MTNDRINPFKHEYFLGYVSQVLPQFIKIHFPSSVLLNGFTHYGEEFNGGLVGNFVLIEGEKYGFLGRIIELILPESERLSLSERAFQTSDFHPVGKIEILLSFDLYQPFTAKKGLTVYPNIGAKVFVCSNDLVQKYMSSFGSRGQQDKCVHLGSLVSDPSTKVEASLQSIFGRHCAVVGTTGGGKSYTVSKLIEALKTLNRKAILIDATGEYEAFEKSGGCKALSLGRDAHFHYSNLSIIDLFVIFRPSGQIQQPALLEAIKSLQLVSILNKKYKNRDKKLTKKENVFEYQYNDIVYSIEVNNGCLKKAGKKTKDINCLYSIFSKEFDVADFDIKKLAMQIDEECYPLLGAEWGKSQDQKNLSYVSSLKLRIHKVIHDKSFDNVFAFKQEEGKSDIIKAIDEFIGINDTQQQLLKISFDSVPYSHQIREILANALGTHLLNKAREDCFKNNPLVFFIDEAHQFINKSVKDEYFEHTKLESIDLISKECRKYGLFLCIATQMPRDIPAGTLSQMGTFIVHRLINYNDKEAIGSACSSANKSTLDFLPILGEGEAILSGVDFPMPIIMKFDKPKFEPNSQTPKI